MANSSEKDSSSRFKTAEDTNRSHSYVTCEFCRSIFREGLACQCRPVKQPHNMGWHHTKLAPLKQKSKKRIPRQNVSMQSHSGVNQLPRHPKDKDDYLPVIKEPKVRPTKSDKFRNLNAGELSKNMRPPHLGLRESYLMTKVLRDHQNAVSL